MFFGVGIGDFITVADLTKKLVSSFKSAPQDFREVAATVQSLDILLDSITNEVHSETSVFRRDPVHGERFNFLIHLCNEPLTRLDDIVGKFESLGTDHVKILDRLRFSKSTVLEIQRVLALRYNNLRDFLHFLGLGGIGRIECGVEAMNTKVDRLQEKQTLILQAVDRVVIAARGRRDTGSLLSDHSNDDKSVWRELRRDLNAAGFKSADIERHKMLIFKKLVQLQQSGAFDWDDFSVADDTSQSSVTFLAHDCANYRPPTMESVLEFSEDEDRSSGRSSRSSSRYSRSRTSHEYDPNLSGRVRSSETGRSSYPNDTHFPRDTVSGEAHTQYGDGSTRSRKGSHRRYRDYGTTHREETSKGRKETGVKTTRSWHVQSGDARRRVGWRETPAFLGLLATMYATGEDSKRNDRARRKFDEMVRQGGERQERESMDD